MQSGSKRKVEVLREEKKKGLENPSRKKLGIQNLDAKSVAHTYFEDHLWGGPFQQRGPHIILYTSNFFQLIW